MEVLWSLREEVDIANSNQRFHKPFFVEYCLVIYTYLVTSGAFIPLFYSMRHPSADFISIVYSMIPFFYVSYVATLILMILRVKLILSKIRHVWPISMFLIWSCISLLWAVDPSVTLTKLTILLGATVVGIYIGSVFNQREQINLLFITLMIALACSVAFVLISPEYGIMTGYHAGNWRGVFYHKNTFGKLVVLFAVLGAILICQAETLRKRLALTIALISSALLVWLSDSAVSKVVTIAMLCLFILLIFQIKNKQVLIPIWSSAIALVLGILLLLVGNLHVVFAALGRSPNLTGRVPLWEALIPMIQSRLWLGYGYGSFWLGNRWPSGAIWNQIGWYPFHAHNGFLEILIDLGLVGLTFFLISYVFISLIAVRKLFVVRRLGHIYRLWPLLYLCFLFLANLTESTLIWYYPFYWILYVALFLTKE